MKAKQGGTLLKGLKTEMVTPTLVGMFKDTKS
jgi:hypothetical protein